jgi:hypothetical protein
MRGTDTVHLALWNRIDPGGVQFGWLIADG